MMIKGRGVYPAPWWLDPFLGFCRAKLVIVVNDELKVLLLRNFLGKDYIVRKEKELDVAYCKKEDVGDYVKLSPVSIDSITAREIGEENE